jgi:tetratricopeptide (TPR) repeat protein
MDQRNTLVDFETQAFFWERYMAQGKEAFSKQRIMDALRMFLLAQKAGACLKDHEKEARTLAWVSLVFYELKNFEKAERAFDQAIELFGANLPDLLEDSQHYLLLAMRYEKQGLSKQAEEAYAQMHALKQQRSDEIPEAAGLAFIYRDKQPQEMQVQQSIPVQESAPAPVEKPVAIEPAQTAKIPAAKEEPKREPIAEPAAEKTQKSEPPAVKEAIQAVEKPQPKPVSIALPKPRQTTFWSFAAAN